MRKIEKDDTVYGQEYVLHSEALKEIDEMQAEIDRLRSEVPGLRGMVDRMTLILKDNYHELNDLRRNAERLRAALSTARAEMGSQDVLFELWTMVDLALSEESKGAT
jgi:uncharacterized coiled-coil DUF342 family protein